jgi:hypothetical protein
MRFFALLMLCALAVPAHAESSPMKRGISWGLHGMALFGGPDGLYASHLPMFHAPHDTQVLFRFHLADKSADKTLRAKLAGQPELWTLEPELFELLRLDPHAAVPLHQFKATLYQGHFERGGEKQLLDQTIIVDQILYFHRLDDIPQQAETAGHYRVIGSEKGAFLVKEIDRRPDFDMIASLALPKTLKNLPKIVDAPGTALTAPQLDAILAERLGPGTHIAKTLYFETDDLQ